MYWSKPMLRMPVTVTGIRQVIAIALLFPICSAMKPQTFRNGDVVRSVATRVYDSFTVEVGDLGVIYDDTPNRTGKATVCWGTLDQLKATSTIALAPGFGTVWVVKNGVSKMAFYKIKEIQMSKKTVVRRALQKMIPSPVQTGYQKVRNALSKIKTLKWLGKKCVVQSTPKRTETTSANNFNLNGSIKEVPKWLRDCGVEKGDRLVRFDYMDSGCDVKYCEPTKWVTWKKLMSIPKCQKFKRSGLRHYTWKNNLLSKLRKK